MDTPAYKRRKSIDPNSAIFANPVALKKMAASTIVSATSAESIESDTIKLSE